jgi:hypothetical protein
LVSALLVIGASSDGIAATASCAALLPGQPEPEMVRFEGRSLGWRGGDSGSRIYQWIVDVPLDGIAQGEVVEIRMAVSQRRGGMVQASSVDVGREPVIGDLYRVGAVRTETGLHTSACGGELTLLEHAKAERPPSSTSPVIGLVAGLGGGVAFAGVAVGVLWFLRGRT